MPSVRRMILGHVMSGMCAKINRKKKLEGDVMDTPLKRCLSTFDITLLGIGHMIGAGIYVLTGPVARDIAGPGVILSFLLAGLASLLAALCYAEFGAKVPKAGSAYVYAYVSVGEFWAFVIGWNIILEHMIGAASVARAWSGYVDSLSGRAISNFTKRLMSGYSMDEPLGNVPDPVAAALCFVYALLLALGVKCSAAVNSLLTLVNLGVMALVICLGFYYADLGNWNFQGHGFLPYGITGVFAGAATCFYAFVGFDSIATSGEEARDPTRSIPRATGLSMAIVTVGYILVSAALTLVEPYSRISRTAALPEAFAARGIPWAKYVISVGALCGMTTTLFGSLFSLPRTMYAMASDGLLFGFLARVSKRTQVPTINLAIAGFVSGLIALLFDLDHLVEFMSIGTFLAYTIVSASVIVLRYRPPPPPSQAMDNTVSSDTTLASSSTHQLASPANTDLAMDSSDCNSMCTSVESQLIQGFCTDGIGRVQPRYAWLSNFLGDCEPGTAVTTSIIFYSVACVSLCSLLVFLSQNTYSPAWWDYVMLINLVIILVASLLVIAAHQQNPPSLGCTFRVPMVPLVPALSILLNIGLMFHLSMLTWLRFLVWMIVGLLIYFLYGIHYSKEAVDPNSYAVLMETAEAERGAKWGSLRLNRKSDTTPILGSEEYLH
ncbi:cationic amino acid transporter 4 [Nasonia vitripennis]|uniref:Cationic amino acid transporter C-terminal domain-containing protein n=1 Tax=Nasonia vitripennis TaxID=7425 RepID=A0A7M7HCD2_NASVI|nr:cationic amino acid transporter 4 [Nasonia vitripennis]XP_008216668.1 cationic amino acid transporter 4 [Nasonia vitripennis]XP_031783238.1 cationic amino acid transporter 4 [Nasonia vitripennis]